MSVIDWDAKPAPWCWVGKQAAAAFKRIANPEFDPPEIKLKRLRMQRGLSAASVSLMAGLPSHTVSNIETLLFTPNKDRRHAIERALGVEVGAIWSEGE